MARSSSWIRFYVRRYFRLAPAYYVCLLIVVVAAPAYLEGYRHLRALRPDLWAGDWVYVPARTRYTAGNLALHASFLFGLFPTYSFSTFLPDWSLSLEMQFYAAFPLIYLAMRRFGTARVAIALSLLSYGVVWSLGVAVAAGKLNPFLEPSLLFFKLPIFLAGMLLYRAASGGLSAWRRAVYVLLAIASCAKLADIYGWQVLWLIALIFILALLSIAPARTTRHFGWISRAFRSRVVSFMSDVSYSVYLFHGVLLALLGSRIALAVHAAGFSLVIGTIGVWAAVVPLTYAFSYLTFRIIEMPGIELGKRS